MHIKKIGRRIYSYTCKGQCLIDREFKPYCDTVFMTENGATVEDLTTYLRKRSRDSSIVINEIEIKSAYYKMDVDTFIAYATKTD